MWVCLPGLLIWDVRSDIYLAIWRSSDRVGERAPLALPFHDPLTFSKLKRTVGARNAGGRNAHRRTTCPRCRSRLAVIRWDGVPGARSGSNPDPKWAIATAAAGATSAHHGPSAAAPPQTLHQVVCRAASPSVPSRRRAVFPGAFPRRVPVAGNKRVRVNTPRFLVRAAARRWRVAYAPASRSRLARKRVPTPWGKRGG
jgi:hypothetical protein